MWVCLCTLSSSHAESCMVVLMQWVTRNSQKFTAEAAGLRMDVWVPRGGSRIGSWEKVRDE